MHDDERPRLAAIIATMLQSQSCRVPAPTPSTAFQTLLPVHAVSVNPCLPLILVRYKTGMVSVLRVADFSTLLVVHGASASSLVEWSCRGDKVLVLDNHVLSEYSADAGRLVGQRRIHFDVLRFATLQHLVVLLDSTRSLLALLPNGQSFPVSANDAFNIDDFMSFEEGMFVVGNGGGGDDDDLCAAKLWLSIRGDLEATGRLEDGLVALSAKKAKTLKTLETLRECLQRWKSAAFIDFVSINQLVHFWIKYEHADSVKRNAAELQRLEVLYKDSLEVICDTLDAEDEDVLQALGCAVSRFTVLLAGADDLELMSVKLSDIVSDLKTLSTDVDFVVRTIVSKLEFAVSTAQQRLSEHCSSIDLRFARCFECVFPRRSVLNAQCIDGDIYVAVKDQQCVHIYRNNSLIWSCSNVNDCKQLFIVSRSVVVFWGASCLYSVREHGDPVCLLSGVADAPIAVSRNASHVVVLLDSNHCRVWEIALLHPE